MRSIVRLAPLLLLAACVIETPGKSTTPSSTTTGSSSTGSTGSSGSTAEPSLPAAASPDAAFVGSGSNIQAGDDPDRTERNCDGAHDHCLPVGVQFATEWQGGAPGEAVVTMPIETGLWAWLRRDVMRGDYRGLPTERATSSNLKVGAVAVAYRLGRSFGDLPRHQGDAVAAEWVIGTVASIDLGTATFRLDGLDDAIPIVAARVAIAR